MVAYFSSKLKKQIYAAFTATLLVFCLLGTQWIGISHSISHAGFHGSSLEVSNSSAVDKSLSHSSDVCHLFDALSLASFVPSTQLDLAALQISALVPFNINLPLLRNIVHSAYQSRAPPTFIL